MQHIIVNIIVLLWFSLAVSDTVSQLSCLPVLQKNQVYLENCSPQSFFHVVVLAFACHVFISLVASCLPSP